MAVNFELLRAASDDKGTCFIVRGHNAERSQHRIDDDCELFPGVGGSSQRLVTPAHRRPVQSMEVAVSASRRRSRCRSIRSTRPGGTRSLDRAVQVLSDRIKG